MKPSIQHLVYATINTASNTPFCPLQRHHFLLSQQDPNDTTYYTSPPNSTLHAYYSNMSSLQTISLGFMFLSSLCVALTWQFAQFIFLLEGVALFAVQLLGVTPTPKVGGYSCLNRVIVHNDDIISTGYPSQHIPRPVTPRMSTYKCHCKL